jgi:hypothetical protein
VELVRDVLDKQIEDKDNVKIGKVDGLIVALRKGRAPRVVALELGTATVAARISPRLGRWVERLEATLGITKGERVRILFEHVTRTGIDVEIDIEGKRTGALEWEDWLRDHVIGPIPGSKR